jgi:hypothetical protein
METASVNSGDGTGQMPQPWMFMMMMTNRCQNFGNKIVAFALNFGVSDFIYSPHTDGNKLSVYEILFI